MITYVAKSSHVAVTDTSTLLVAADRDRTHLELVRNGGGPYVGGADVSPANGYVMFASTPIVLEGNAAQAAVYGITDTGTTGGIIVLEVVQGA